MMKVRAKFIVVVVIGFVAVQASVIGSSVRKLETELDLLNYNEDAIFTPRQLIEKYGYWGETHEVRTQDGYILELHRITGPNSNRDPDGKQPILLVHGLLSSSIDWIIMGPDSAFGYLLAEDGYDVWMGNVRGNAFSRKHEKYSTEDKEYWQFSWHEIGTSDIPAMLDYVLEKTDRKQLIYAGHSQGTTGFFVMASELPEYQDKVKAMIALAPVAYLTYIRSPFFRVLATFGNNIGAMMSVLGVDEFAPTSDFLKEVIGIACDQEALTQPLCLSVISLISGYGSDQVNKTMVPVILGHVPAGAAVLQVIHYAQVINARKFRQYDYGVIGNMKKYGQLRPPRYDLSKIKVPVSLHYSKNDWLAHPKDVSRLHKELGNPIGKIRVPHSTFGHLDFIWGKDAKQLLFDEVICIIGKYRD